MIVSATKPCLGTPLPRVTPESVGVRSADVAAFVDEARARGINLHSFLMLRGDKVETLSLKRLVQAHGLPVRRRQILLPALTHPFPHIFNGVNHE